MKKELLSPAGNFDSLISAIHNGCDAVYLGGKKFGARAYSNNFSDEEMIKAIKYCHLYGVKIYVTVNTLLFDSELEDVLSYIRFLHQNQVDALIMQDLGLISLVRHTFPNLEIHASTQMHTHNEEQLKLLERLGVKRVVLARELSLEEIKNFKTSLELEVFIHGALCVCYSGQCLFSSLLMNRSGNRGCCAGICRLPFKLYCEGKEIKTEGKYLLSPKELNTMDFFDEIKKTEITSLKIEGRMKSSEYVGLVTRLYRKLLDGNTLTLQEKKEIAVLFNRSFTKGFLFKETFKSLMNIKTPNHQGILLGQVLEIRKDKIKILLEEDLIQNDGIRFKEEDKGFIVNFLYNEKGLLIHHASKGSIVYLDNKVDLKTKGKVLKTIDSQLMESLNRIDEKKIPIHLFVKAKLGHPLEVTFSDEQFTIQRFGKVVSCALQKPVKEALFVEKIGALGNTPFVLKKWTVDMDSSIFVSMSELKALRRELVDALKKKREEQIVHPFFEVKRPLMIQQEEKETTQEVFFHVLVRNEEQLLCCLDLNVATIYVTDEELYKKYKRYEQVYLRLARVQPFFKDYQDERLLITESGSLFKYSPNNLIVTDYYLNVTNRYTFNYLESFNVKRITLSIENSFQEIQSICKVVPSHKFELFLYGRPEVMVMKTCPLNYLVNQNKVCSVCLEKKNYYFSDGGNKKFPILTSPKKHITHLFFHEVLSRDFLEYKRIGIQHFRIELFNESSEEIKSILCKYR